MATVHADLQDYKRPGALWLTMKEKHKNIIEAADETEQAFEFLGGMFEYEGLPDTVRAEFLEQYFLTNGSASIRRDTKGDGEFYAMIADDGSTPNPYGLGQKVFSRTANGHVYEDDRDSEDVVIGYNNLTKTPCLDAYRIGAYIAEIDTSLDLLVWWSRASKLFLASDNKQKQMLMDAFAAMKKGVPLTVVSDNLLREIEEGKKSIEAEDLSDTDYADKMDKLAYLRECRYKWFKERYGMAQRTQSKKAQISVDEANGDTGASMIVPLNMLACRKKFIEECNKKFGWSASVHFAGAWLGEIERYETTVVENGAIDIDGYDAILEEKEGKPDEPDDTQEDREGAEPQDEADGADAAGSSDKDRKDGIE